jgi:uncharacterized protein with PQ loop repeat
MVSPGSWLPTLLGATTVAIAIGVSLPQLIKLWHGRGTAGVSLPGAVNSAISFCAWTVYALVIGDGWLIASSAIGTPFAVAAALAAWRCGASRSGLWLPAAWSAALLATAAAEAARGWHIGHLVVGGSIAWTVVPAAVAAWTSPDVSGVAATSWWVLAGEGTAFFAYGLAEQVAAPVLYGALAMAGSGAILFRLSRPSTCGVTGGSASPQPEPWLPSRHVFSSVPDA